MSPEKLDEILTQQSMSSKYINEADTDKRLPRIIFLLSRKEEQGDCIELPSSLLPSVF